MAEIVALERSSGKESASRDQDPSYSLTIYNLPRRQVPLLGRSLVSGAREQ